jgi:hypothetical protein
MPPNAHRSEAPEYDFYTQLVVDIRCQRIEAWLREEELDKNKIVESGHRDKVSA